MKKGDVVMFIVEDDIKNELQLLNIGETLVTDVSMTILWHDENRRAKG